MSGARELRSIPLESIQEPPHQLRETIDPDALRELADSLLRVGLLEPIGLAPTDADPPYEIIYGHRRFLAAVLLGWKTIDAIIDPGLGDKTNAALAENLHRADLTPLEEARALAQLLDQGKHLDDLAHIVRKSESWVRDRLALLDWPEDLQRAVHARGMPVTVARQLLAVDHADYRAYLIEQAIQGGTTARVAAVWVQHYLSERPRVIANTETVETIAATRFDFVIMVPCEYCLGKDDLQNTRSWRLCARCDKDLRQARELALKQ